MSADLMTTETAEMLLRRAEAAERQVHALERKLAWANAKMREIEGLLYGELRIEPDFPEPEAVRRAWAIARENS